MNMIPVPQEYAAFSRDLEPVPRALVRAGAGDDNDLLSIAMLGNEQYMTVGAIRYIGQRIEAAGEPHVWLHHRPLGLEQKRAMFSAVRAGIEASLDSPEPVRPVKTVTMSIPGEGSPHVAVTSLDQPVTKRVRQAIATDLRVSPKVVKSARLNPEELDTVRVLGLAPGVVGPFVAPAAAARMRAWFYMSAPISETAPVDIAISSQDSLVMQRRGFEALLENYNRDFLLGRTAVRYIK